MNADEDPYDPAKPEYLISASDEEVEAGELQLLESQITCLEDALAKRLDTLDPVVAKHYSSVLDEMYSSPTGKRLMRHVRAASCPDCHSPHVEQPVQRHRLGHKRHQSEPAAPQGAMDGSLTGERLVDDFRADASPAQPEGHDPFSTWDGEGTATPTKAAREPALTVETVIVEAEAPPGWETDSERGDGPEEEEVEGLDGEASTASTATDAVAEVAPSCQQEGKICSGHGDAQDILGMFVAYEGIVDLSNTEQRYEHCQGHDNLEHDAPSIAQLLEGSSPDLQKECSEINDLICEGEAKEYNQVDYEQTDQVFETVPNSEALDKVQADTAEASTLWRFWEVVSSVARIT